MKEPLKIEEIISLDHGRPMKNSRREEQPNKRFFNMAPTYKQVKIHLIY